MPRQNKDTATLTALDQADAGLPPAFLKKKKGKGKPKVVAKVKGKKVPAFLKGGK